ncbi:HtaA domain-containing protein [Leucobacter japonicus]|uniref:HtaA domain-containing protein n=1 Tax=Leucobacter japonicus TaxID=1461259 RepID=UPI0006A7D6EE|nr:Ig-like domain repeat protein [Leucobacter japonicus]
MTAQKSWRRLLATATAGLLVAGGAVLVPAAANAAPGEGVVADATLSWGVKTSFRNYITSPIAKGTATVLGATTGDGPYSWTGGTGSANLDGSDLDIAFGENDGVHFQGHASGDDFILDLAFTQPQIKITSPTTAEFYLDVDGREYVDTTTVGDTYSLDDVHFADVVLPAPTVSGSSYTWTNAAATMTPEGLAAFGGFYNATTAGLDPITFTAPIAAVPATETTTTLSASTPTATAGDAVELTATVAPAAAAGAVTFSNGATAIGSAVPVSNGVAKLSTSDLPVGENAITATFTPTDAASYAASTSSSSVVTVTEKKVWAPKIEVFQADGVTPVGNTRVSAGDKLVVKGSGFDPEANVGGRGVPIPNTLPQGTYVVFGEFGENWQPSKNAASTERVVAAQGWVLTENTVDQIPTNFQSAVRGQWVELNADGSFEWTATLQNRDASKPATTNGSYGVFTYGAGGVNNASQEQAVRVNYGAPLVATTTTLSSNAASVLQGDDVELRAEISPADQAGTVQFLNGSVALGAPAQVQGGVATLTTAQLPVGTNEITAKFTPADAANVINSTSNAIEVTVAVKPAITIGGQEPGAAQVRQGEAVEFAVGPYAEGNEFEVWIDPAVPAARVAAAADAPAANEPIQLENVVVDSSGVAAVKWDVPADFALGDHVIEVRGLNVPATLRANFTVSEAAPQITESTTTLTTSATVGGSPKGVEFTATIAPSTATGTVTFTNNGASIGTVPVEAGIAKVTTDLVNGNNVIVASFASNDESVAGSVSNSLEINVTITDGTAGSGSNGAADGGANGAGTGANGSGSGNTGGTVDSVVTKPAVAGAKGLATTGGGDFTGLLVGGAFVLLLGAGLMIGRRRATA